MVVVLLRGVVRGWFWGVRVIVTSIARARRWSVVYYVNYPPVSANYLELPENTAVVGKILNITFWTKVTFDSLGQKIPRILLGFGIGGGWLTDGIPAAWRWRCSVWFWKIEIYGKMFPLFPFSFPFFLFLLLSLFFLSFSSPSRSWDYQSYGGWRKS